MALQTEIVLKIIELYKDNKTMPEIATELSLVYDTVYRIITGRSYASITGIKRNNIRRTDDSLLIEMINNGDPITKVAKHLNISPPAVSKKYKDLTGRSIRDVRKNKTVKYGS